MFLSDGADSSASEASVVKKTEEKSRKRKSEPSKPSTSKKTKPYVSPAAVPRSTARDLFGSDSDDECCEAGNKSLHSPIYSYFTRRLANGFSRQVDMDKTGEYYIEVKIYKHSEIKNVTPVNRWRQSILTIKNSVNEDAVSWGYLKKFIKSTKKEFKTKPPTFIGSY